MSVKWSQKGGRGGRPLSKTASVRVYPGGRVHVRLPEEYLARLEMEDEEDAMAVGVMPTKHGETCKLVLRPDPDGYRPQVQPSGRRVYRVTLDADWTEGAHQVSAKFVRGRVYLTGRA